MNVVDSCGWLEYFADGPNAGFFAKPLEDPKRLVVPTLTILEVFQRVLTERGEATAIEAAAAMYKGRVVDLDASLVLNAARLGVELKLPLAPSVILATAQANKAMVWTQDDVFKDVAGVKYLTRS